MTIEPPFDWVRMVRIPIRIADGVPTPFYGGALPKFKNGVIGELVLPEYAVNADLATLLNAPLTFDILPAKTQLLAGVRGSHPPKVLKPKMQFVAGSEFDGFVSIQLLDSLRLRLRGTKRAALMGCTCSVPALNERVGSVNEAYTLISRHYEPRRRSHTGNVFKVVFFKSANAQGERVWEPLDELRMRMEATLEGRFRSAAPGEKAASK